MCPMTFKYILGLIEVHHGLYCSYQQIIPSFLLQNRNEPVPMHTPIPHVLQYIEKPNYTLIANLVIFWVGILFIIPRGVGRIAEVASTASVISHRTSSPHWRAPLNNIHRYSTSTWCQLGASGVILCSYAELKVWFGKKSLISSNFLEPIGLGEKGGCKMAWPPSSFLK